MATTWRRNRAREPDLAELLERHSAPVEAAQYWEAQKPLGEDGKPLSAFLTRDNIAAGDDFDPRWHISVNGGGRIPRWDELASAAHALRPGVVFVAGVPPRSWWINVHEHVLHLWEMRDDALAGQWRSERSDMAPTA